MFFFGNISLRINRHTRIDAIYIFHIKWEGLQRVGRGWKIVAYAIIFKLVSFTT